MGKYKKICKKASVLKGSKSQAQRKEGSTSNTTVQDTVDKFQLRVWRRKGYIAINVAEKRTESEAETECKNPEKWTKLKMISSYGHK